MLFVVIKDFSYSRAQENICRAQSEGADGIELRVDHLEKIDLKEIEGLMHASPLPCMLTLRTNAQGGKYNGSKKEQLSLLEQLAHLKPAFLDLEMDLPLPFFEKMGREHPSVKLICSFHDVEKTPDLEPLFAEMRKKPAYAYKIACQARSSLDALEMVAFARKKHLARQRLIALSMSSAGIVSRALSPVVGNLLTYATLEEESKESGLLSLHTLQNVYNYKTLTPASAIYALIGDPVDQSPSQRTHNRVFAEHGLSAVYVKIALKPEELARFFSLVRTLPFRGASVTMPHKEAVFPFLDEISEEAKAIGAVNTLLIKDGKIRGENTDARGGLDALEEKTAVSGKKVLLLGAGGTARALAFEAKKRGAHVTLSNRTQEKGERVAKQLGCAFSTADSPYDILVNATSCGEELPLAETSIAHQKVVMEVLMHPKETPLLRAALAKECALVFGHTFFIRQALYQFSLWFDSRINLTKAKHIMESQL